MNNEIEIVVNIYFPWYDKGITRKLKIPSHTLAYESFVPLPRDREIYKPEAVIAAKQIIDRGVFMKAVAEHLSSSVEEAVKSRDTINGYSPEEWKD